jgi:hypothetical protein
MPGGGFRDPHQRPAAKVAEDVALSLVSTKSRARTLYGVAPTSDGKIDEAEMARLPVAAE